MYRCVLTLEMKASAPVSVSTTTTTTNHTPTARHEAGAEGGGEGGAGGGGASSGGAATPCPAPPDRTVLLFKEFVGLGQDLDLLTKAIKGDEYEKAEAAVSGGLLSMHHARARDKYGIIAMLTLADYGPAGFGRCPPEVRDLYVKFFVGGKVRYFSTSSFGKLN